MTRTVAVIDIGKTNAKVVLVDMENLSEVSARRMPNRVGQGGPYPHHDVEAIWAFILESLGTLAKESRIDAVSVTTHGATAVLLDAGDNLALPVLDYEHDGPDALRASYDTVRPPFAETGTPPLPIGLNLGAQIHWQQQKFADQFARTASILTYPQYWAWRLTGVLASEVTSLGCHTDLWNPAARDYSSLVDRMEWRNLFPPLRAASDRLGTILPGIAKATGLDPATPVHCGIHDSNASLLPHLLARKGPFAVVSTGTWVVSMAVGGEQVRLDPERDTLINVNAFGDPVPSARFMGGREYELLTAGLVAAATDAAVVDSVLDRRIALLPSVQQGSGPFPTSASQWIGGHEPWDAAERRVSAAFYVAMMTATCIDLIGARGDIVVEGPFARNEEFIGMLAAATGRRVLPQAGQAGTSVGCALLAGGATLKAEVGKAVVESDPRWSAYAAHWRGTVLR